MGVYRLLPAILSRSTHGESIEKSAGLFPILYEWVIFLSSSDNANLSCHTFYSCIFITQL